MLAAVDESDPTRRVGGGGGGGVGGEGGVGGGVDVYNAMSLSLLRSSPKLNSLLKISAIIMFFLSMRIMFSFLKLFFSINQSRERSTGQSFDASRDLSNAVCIKGLNSFSRILRYDNSS